MFMQCVNLCIRNGKKKDSLFKARFRKGINTCTNIRLHCAIYSFSSTFVLYFSVCCVCVRVFFSSSFLLEMVLCSICLSTVCQLGNVSTLLREHPRQKAIVITNNTFLLFAFRTKRKYIGKVPNCTSMLVVQHGAYTHSSTEHPDRQNMTTKKIRKQINNFGFFSHRSFRIICFVALTSITLRAIPMRALFPLSGPYVLCLLFGVCVNNFCFATLRSPAFITIRHGIPFLDLPTARSDSIPTLFRYHRHSFRHLCVPFAAVVFIFVFQLLSPSVGSGCILVCIFWP